MTTDSIVGLEQLSRKFHLLHGEFDDPSQAVAVHLALAYAAAREMEAKNRINLSVSGKLFVINAILAAFRELVHVRKNANPRLIHTKVVSRLCRPVGTDEQLRRLMGCERESKDKVLLD